MFRPTAAAQKLKVAQKATKTVPQIGFARPSTSLNPLHLYRQALRLAHRIAKRWDDPYIFHYHRLKAARQLRAPPTISRSHVAGAQHKREKVESTMSPAEFNRFKRLKACVSTLTRAEMGHSQPMYKVLGETYGRTGVLRAAAMEHLLPNLDPACTIPQPTWAVLKLIQSPVTSSSSPDATVVRNLRRYTRLNPAIAAGEVQARLPLEERKLKNRTQHKVFGKIMDGLRPPLAYDVVRKVEDNARRAIRLAREEGGADGAAEGGKAVAHPSSSQGTAKGASQSKWEEQDFSQGGPILKEALQALGTRPRRGPPKDLELGPLHPSSKWYARARRRAWGMLLSELPMLSPTPPPATLAELVESQDTGLTTPESTAEEEDTTDTSPTSSPFPPSHLLPPHLEVQPPPYLWKNLWGSRPRFPTDNLRPLLEAFNAQEHARHIWSGQADLDAESDAALEVERAALWETYGALSWSQKRGKRWKERAEQWVKDPRLSRGKAPTRSTDSPPPTPSSPRPRATQRSGAGPDSSLPLPPEQERDPISSKGRRGPPPEEQVHLYISPLALRGDRTRGGAHSEKPRRARFGSEMFVSEEEAGWARRTSEEEEKEEEEKEEKEEEEKEEEERRGEAVERSQSPSLVH